MKCYNVQNYIRYKKDIKQIVKRTDFCRPWDEMTRDELVLLFMPLAENLARKFSTTQQASGVMTINDLIQEANKNLVIAVDKIIWDTIYEADDPEQRLKSFLSKRIKGGVRIYIYINRVTMRIPEHKLNEIRKNPKDEKMVAMFFNSVFSSIDAKPNDDENLAYQVVDKSEPYNIALLNTYLLSLMKTHLTPTQYDVLRMSYGLDCDKHSANDIASKLGINVSTAHVRISQIKRDAIQQLIDNVDSSQVLDYL